MILLYINTKTRHLKLAKLCKNNMIIDVTGKDAYHKYISYTNA